MHGSAVKKTMASSALPIQTEVHIHCDASQQRADELIYHALAASPADALMRTSLPSLFKITKNGKDLEVAKVKPSKTPKSDDPATLFEQLTPADAASFATAIYYQL